MVSTLELQGLELGDRSGPRPARLKNQVRDHVSHSIGQPQHVYQVKTALHEASEAAWSVPQRQ